MTVQGVLGDGRMLDPPTAVMPALAQGQESRDVLPRPGWGWACALFAAIAGGVVPILAMWWRDTSPGSLQGLGDHLAAAGRVTGLVGAYLLLVLVFLMARIPWLENRVGSDVTARIHRALGEYTVILLVAHAVLLIVGYADQGHTGVVHETYVVAVSYPDVMMAIVALGLIVLVGVVSARAVRRRMVYETWHFIHLYVYLALGLAFAHEFAVGSDFADSRTARAAWVGLHAMVAILLVAFRLILPVLASLQHGVRVERVVYEGPGVVSVHLSGRHLDRLRAESGQFFRWRFLARGMWWESHPYSLSAPPTDELLRITVKELGDGSGRLAGLAPGTRVWFEGPYGAFTAKRGRPDKRGAARRTLLIAGGAGITPIRALYETVPGSGADVILLYRASKVEDLVFWRELETVAHQRGFGLYPMVGSREEHGGDPMNVRSLRRLVPDLVRRDVFVCGPTGLVESTLKQLLKAGVPRGRVHLESFDM